MATRDRLFDVMRELRAAGTSILFISHRMDEVEEIADRVTVMRSGRTVGTLARKEASTRRLVALMTGVEDSGHEIRRAEAAQTRVRDTVLVRTRGVCLHEGSKPIDVEVRAGELVGVAGLEGHGQDAFLRVLAGVSPPAGAVECLTGPEPRPLHSPAEARAAGIAYVPRDRRDESIFETRSILENFQVATLEADRRRGLLRRSAAPTLGTLAPFAIAGMASTPAFLSGRGGIDLSIAPLMGFTNILLVTKLFGTVLGGPEFAVPILLAIGAAIGAVNGLMIARLRIPP